MEPEGRGGGTIYKEFKEKNCQTRILYPAKLIKKNKSDIKIFPNNKKLIQCVVIRLVLQEIVKKVLPSEKTSDPRQ